MRGFGAGVAVSMAFGPTAVPRSTSASMVAAASPSGILESWQVVVLNAEIAESAARVRTSFRLKLADAVQVASALAVNADALVTHDRDFTNVQSLRVIS